ncbi:glucosyltransferase domain-containing protein [uncultured Subdoligranulum sp.]|uniref:glucosyltransferase domain-containing protein n=1 Tax=uncultured Subdoligranulum sp. TaxID=512298 RepID=UPI0025FCEF5D|nr:glucosyltransferase domain-containing protein [uncultured Subdoligranulum sp.]
MAATFFVGLFAYGFSMSNILLGQDNSNLWYDVIETPADFFAPASAGRWLANIGFVLFGGVTIPWWNGLWSLLLIGLAVFVTCRLFQIRSAPLQVLVAAVMTACPAVVTSFNYISSAPTYALALLTACLAPYFLYRHKWGFIPAFLCMLLTNAIYTAYISVTVCWVILYALQQLILVKQDCRTIFLQELFAAVLSLLSLAGTLAISQVLVRLVGSTAQQRVTNAVAMGLTDYLQRIGQVYGTVLYRIFSNWKSSYMQGLGCLSVRAAVVLGVVCALLLLYKNKSWRNPVTLLLLAVNALMLPLAMDIIGILQVSHSLMDYAYVTPMLASLVLLSAAWEQGALPEVSLVRTALPLLLVAANGVYALHFVKVANIDATFRFAQYESAVQLTNRLIDRLEAEENYQPGKTPVLVAGKFPENYYFTEGEWGLPSDEAFRVLKNIEGANSWMAFTYQELFERFSEQVIGTELNLITDTTVNGGTSFTTDTDVLLTRAQEADSSITAAQLDAALADCSGFPSGDCCIWVGDILVLKLDFGAAVAAA